MRYARTVFHSRKWAAVNEKRSREVVFMRKAEKRAAIDWFFSLKTSHTFERVYWVECREELNKKAIDLTCYRWYRFLHRIHHTRKSEARQEKRNLLKRKRKLNKKACWKVGQLLRESGCFFFVSLLNSSYSVRAIIVISFLCLLGWEDGWGVGFEVWV